MQKNTSFTLGNHFEGFITKEIKDGRFNSASEVVRAGLRLLEEHEQKVMALRAALIEGETSGISQRSVQDIISAKESALEKRL